MSQILNDNEIKEFKKNGAIHLKGKFDIKWIEKLKVGINKAKLILVLDLPIILRMKNYRVI